MYRKLIIFITVCMCMATAGTADASQPGSEKTDDVLQFTPYAAVFALKACGVNSQSDWKEMTLTAATSFVVSAGIAYTLKHSVHEWRPDHSDRRSFPSGHTTFAFAGATVLHHEYRHVSPWISVGGYAVAAVTAIDRVRNDRHHWYDVAAGAGIGILSTELTYFVAGKIFPRRNVSISVGGNTLDVAVRL